ncbi:hypothetical protein C5167_017973 [Papaver somniferum]|uniref:Amidase domain-containing protein n=1 Tax=Papaver somniferum TaxID=3469 RepID=A0A4Y7ILE3_PAPSO|nr:hypothetical protein C5167_017973 [Papaver somniferum]
MESHHRNFFINLLLILILSFFMSTTTGSFSIREASIRDIQQALLENELTSRQLVEFYLHEIQTLNPLLRAVIEVNPDALDLADEADSERIIAKGSQLGELHGIPILLKDTIGTKDKLNTTSGSYALLGSVVPRDAGVVEKLRKSGALILGKTSLSEWAYMRSFHSPKGWSARAGQGKNPYVLSGTPCGSSSGSAISVAANLVTVSLGAETHGSILCPSSHNSVVGIKPTVGLTSRAGVIPVAPRQDTIGPICRTVSDAVYVLDAILGFDQLDAEATKAAEKYIPDGGYKQFLKKDGLAGKRIGIVRHPFFSFPHESNISQEAAAVLVDNLEIEHIDIITNPGHSGELTVMKAEFKQSLNIYLKELITSPVRSLANVIAFNQNHKDLEKVDKFPQDMLVAAENTHGMDGEKEKAIVEHLERLSRDGFEKLMSENKLDTIVTPGSDFAAVLAIGGYPGISVPAAYDEDNDGMPVGICFGGLRGTEPKLIEIAYGFEQATLIRRPPSLKSEDDNRSITQLLASQ